MKKSEIEQKQQITYQSSTDPLHITITIFAWEFFMDRPLQSYQTFGDLRGD